jgi:hypothetical protein
MEYTNTVAVIHDYYYNFHTDEGGPASLLSVVGHVTGEEANPMVEQLICDCFFSEWTGRPIIII